MSPLTQGLRYRAACDDFNHVKSLVLRASLFVSIRLLHTRVGRLVRMLP